MSIKGKLSPEAASELLSKLTEKMGADVATELRAHSSEKIKELIIDLGKQVQEIDEEKRGDAMRSKLMEDLKFINGGYRDLKKDRTNRIDFLLALLTDRGVG